MGLIACAQTLSFLVNFVSTKYPAWKDKTFLMALVGGTLMSLLFIHGTRFMLEGSESFWTAKLMTSVSGTVLFAVMAWYFNSEPITMKTAVSILLAFSIVAIQVFWK